MKVFSKVMKHILAIIAGIVSFVLAYCVVYYIISFLGSLPIIGALLYYPSDAAWAITVLPPTAAGFAAASVSLKIAKTAKPISVIVMLFWAFNIISMFLYDMFTWRECVSSLFGIGTGLVGFTLEPD